MTSSERRKAVELGTGAPAFELRATDGEVFSLGSFSPDQLLVMVFLANRCSYVSAWEDRIIMLAVEHAGRGAAFVAVNSNDARRHPEDGFEAMRRRAHERHYPFPYLHDADGALARTAGATITPEIFVYDRHRALRYHGAVDSEVDEKRNPIPYLKLALDGLIVGDSIRVAESEPVGCPIEPREATSDADRDR